MSTDTLPSEQQKEGSRAMHEHRHMTCRARKSVTSNANTQCLPHALAGMSCAGPPARALGPITPSRI